MIGLLEVLGERIRELRGTRGMSQEELAAAADISREYVGDIEYGRYKMSVTVLVSVAKALGTEGWILLQHAEHKARK
jgi:XRE family aerobic/anaerobic benzoate catabolism transcriptional regulator